MSNEAILIKTNELLPEHQRASIKAFSYAMKEPKEGEDTDPETMLYVKRFREVYKKALYKQEAYIMGRLQEDENKRQKRARILERKRKAWNLKHISEHTENKTTNNNYNINIIQPTLPAGVDVLQPIQIIEPTTPSLARATHTEPENLTAV